MLHLDVLVRETRDRTAVVTLFDGLRRVREDACVAATTPKVASALGNPGCSPLRPAGHPPFGSYLLLRHAPAPAGCEVEYGKDLLLFEAQDGEALEAESFGRLALLVYSGPAGADALPRRTQGGVRLTKAMMNDITSRLAAAADFDLRIRPLAEARAWWHFWKPRPAVDTLPLSSDVPHLVAPPLDEASLIAALLAGTSTRRRGHTAWDRDDDRDRISSDGGSSPGRGTGSEPFRGGGGEYAGAGASDSWGAGAAGRNGGVDAAGRIVGGAAGIAAAAAAGEAALSPSDAAASRSDSGPSAAPADGGDSGTASTTSY